MTGEVLVIASDERQARIALRLAMRMVELNEELSERARVFRDKIEVPTTGSAMVAAGRPGGAARPRSLVAAD